MSRAIRARKGAAMTLRQRAPRQRDAAHLAFVRAQPCCIKHCNRPAEAAHSDGLSRDRQGIHRKRREAGRSFSAPLCAYHHRTGVAAQHTMAESAFWEMVGLNPFAIAAELWIASAEKPGPRCPSPSSSRERSRPASHAISGRRSPLAGRFNRAQHSKGALSHELSDGRMHQRSRLVSPHQEGADLHGRAYLLPFQEWQTMPAPSRGSRLRAGRRILRRTFLAFSLIVEPRSASHRGAEPLTAQFDNRRNRHRPPEQRLQEDAPVSERPTERSKDSVEHQGISNDEPANNPKHLRRDQ